MKNDIAELRERIEHLEREANWYRHRVELLASVQKFMRDPERTVVCDIIANGQLLPDPKGSRYGFDPQTRFLR